MFGRKPRKVSGDQMKKGGRGDHVNGAGLVE